MGCVRAGVWSNWATVFSKAIISRSELRQEDVDEWFVAGGGKDVRVLIRSCPMTDYSSRTRVISTYDDKPLALYGSIRDEFGNANIWLIATKEARKHVREILALWKQEANILNAWGGIMYATVMNNNVLHVRWLKSVGFEPVCEKTVGGFGFTTYALRNNP